MRIELARASSETGTAHMEPSEYLNWYISDNSDGRFSRWVNFLGANPVSGRCVFVANSHPHDSYAVIAEPIDETGPHRAADVPTFSTIRSARQYIKSVMENNPGPSWGGL